MVSYCGDEEISRGFAEKEHILCGGLFRETLDDVFRSV